MGNELPSLPLDAYLMRVFMRRGQPYADVAVHAPDLKRRDSNEPMFRQLLMPISKALYDAYDVALRKVEAQDDARKEPEKFIRVKGDLGVTVEQEPPF